MTSTASIQDMRREDIQGEYQETQLTFFDGTRRRVLYTEVEAPYPDGRLIVSRTDPNGIITHVNRSFVDMSAYSEDELIGVPQYILRHPLMPASAYSDLWNTIQAGRKWNGYIKNLRKDGGFYWVFATVIPNVRQGKIVGYASVRRKPARRKVEEAEAHYASLRG